MVRDRKVLLVLGMGRSGTSFVANWLHECGLSMGSVFWVGDKKYNLRGFYEDLEFYKLYTQILLKRNNTSIIRKGLNENLYIDNQIKIQFKKLIDQRNNTHMAWGMKHPMTHFFYHSIWHELLPNANILIVFRHYSLVIQSILKVSYLQKSKLKSNLLKIRDSFGIGYRSKCNQLLTNWINQHNILLQIYESGKDCCIIDSSVFSSKANALFEYLKNMHAVPLQFKDINEIFDPSLFDNSITIKLNFDSTLELQAQEIFNKLTRYTLKD